MNINKLHFFDNSGYELNFGWNDIRNCWEGNIYLPKTSVGLYANTTIYVLEEVNGKYVFPQYTSGRKEIIFSWDLLNKFVDEFFMFTFDSSYIQKDTSSLTFTENDGPDCEPVLITRFDEYKIDLGTNNESRALPIHVAFISLEKYDANTFKRTLVMSHNFKTIARINFYAETIEEDERLKVLTENFGYNLTKKDSLIFKNSDIKESCPDFSLLNEKRKELMLEGHNIYPYIGTYKGLINAIKFFGYDNLNIIEYWRNVNTEDNDFGKLYHVKKYSLTDNEYIYINNHKLSLPNVNYKKLSNIALSYRINKPISKLNDNEDENKKIYNYIYELPYTKEIYDYTIEEAVIKLFALRDKLNKDFLSTKSKIIDITGESNYFGLCGIKHNPQFAFTTIHKSGKNISIDAFPNNIIRIDRNKFLKEYIYKYHIPNEWNKSPNIDNNTILGNIYDKKLNEYFDKNISDEDVKKYISTEEEKCDIYKKFYDEFKNNKLYLYDINNDLDDYFSYDFKDDDTETIKHIKSFTTNSDSYLSNSISAKVVLSNTSFITQTFSNTDGNFDNINNIYNFNNIDTSDLNYIVWTISYSKDQIDEDLNNIGIKKEYSNKHKNWSCTKEGLCSEYGSVFFELPYIGYYDVQVSLTDNYNNVSSMVFTKYIKVEPYNLDIRGFYYDAREIPDELIKDKNYKEIFNNKLNSYEYPNQDKEFYLEMKKFIEKKLEYMTAVSTAESSTTNQYEMSMPVYRTNFDRITIDNVEYIKYYTNKTSKEYFFIYKNNPDYDKKNPIIEKKYIRYRYRYYENKYKLISKVNTNIIIGYKSIDGSTPFEVVNTGPYTFDNYNDLWLNADNINLNITRLIPDIQSARYIKNGVDIKPYTWILLGYSNSKICGKINPIWTLKNITTGETLLKNETNYTHNGKFLTYLLTKEGNYEVTLSINDINGNTYEISRNIIVVSKDANYKLYTPFINDFYEIYDSLKNENYDDSDFIEDSDEEIIEDFDNIYDSDEEIIYNPDDESDESDDSDIIIDEDESDESDDSDIIIDEGESDDSDSDSDSDIIIDEGESDESDEDESDDSDSDSDSDIIIDESESDESDDDSENNIIGNIIDNQIHINTDQLSSGTYTLYYVDENGNELPSWSPITTFNL